jgi:pyruvate/2-oxoglutarate dehydrogenase complex dihydrolipoamide acyltransferase (E2) component
LVQAAVTALQSQPVVNAVIDGDDIIYRDYIDISIAVGTPKVWPNSINSFLYFFRLSESDLKNEFHLSRQILRLITFAF